MTPPLHRRLPAAVLLLALAAAFLPVDARPAAPGLDSEVAGSGEPTLVLIHGLGSDRRVWGRVAPMLEQRHRVLLVDLPGYGRSPLEGTPSVSAAARALDRTLKDRKINRPVLVGHSYGGLVALQEALANPGRVSGVVAIDITTYLPVDSERVATMDQLMTERYPLFVRAVFAPMTHRAVFQDTVVAWALAVPESVLTAYFRDAWRTDLRPQMRKLKVPILVVATSAVWPDSESWTAARVRMGYESAGPATGTRVHDSFHLIPIDQPDSLATAIEHFAAGLKK